MEASDEGGSNADRVIAGKFRLKERLGKGGMGSVWRAQHMTLGFDVAVKLIDEKFSSDEAVRARFFREARATAQLKTPHVVQVMDYGEEEGTPYIVMEFLVGETLGARLDRLGRLTAEATAVIVADVARGLSKAHQAGIIHRDLKPENVFLVDNGERELAKVVDFGVAKEVEAMLGDASMTKTGIVVGTPYYMSPEQSRASKELDHRSDLWGLGVIAYECMTGHRPFAGETLAGIFVAICSDPLPRPSDLAPTPAGFDAWFQKAVSRDLDQRFHSAGEMAEQLRKLCGLASLPGLDAAVKTESFGTRLEASPVFDAAEPQQSRSVAATLMVPQEEERVSEFAASTAGVTATPTNRARGLRSPGWLFVVVGAIVSGALAIWLVSGSEAEERAEEQLGVEAAAQNQTGSQAEGPILDEPLAEPPLLKTELRQDDQLKAKSAEQHDSRETSETIEPGGVDENEAHRDASSGPSPSAAAPLTPASQARSPKLRAAPRGKVPAPRVPAPRPQPQPQPATRPTVNLGI